MSETKLVDARGLSCPQPVLITEKALKELKKGTIEVLVDTNTAQDNVTRLATHNSWNVQVEKQADGSVKLILTK